MNHNICVLSLIIFSLYAVIKNIQKYRQYHEQRPIRTSQCFRTTKIQSRGAGFLSFWQKVNKNETISEHDERWNINNLSFIATLKVTNPMEQRAKATIPCEQRFLSCMAFSVFINEVVRMASLSRSYFVYALRPEKQK